MSQTAPEFAVSTEAEAIAELAMPVTPELRCALADVGVVLRERVQGHQYLVALSRAVPLDRWADLGIVALRPLDMTTKLAPPLAKIIKRWQRGLTILPPLSVVVVYWDSPAEAKFISPEAVLTLAESAEVRGIDLCSAAATHSDTSLAVMGLGKRQPSPLQGQGEIVAVCDTGLCKGDLASLHGALDGRVRQIQLLHPKSDGNDRWNHGTSVAALVAGAPVDSALGLTSGAAPQATVVFQVSSAGQRATGALPPGDLTSVLQRAWDAGARVQCNAWGQDAAAGDYDLWAYSVDQFVARHPEFLACFSAGNTSDPAPHTVTPPGTARNAVSVGTSLSPEPRAPQAAKAITGCVASNSAEGPVRGTRRIKPDLVVTATRLIAPVGQDGFRWASGTSFAVPIVAGAAAVVRSWLRFARGCANPSAALVRALLVAGAVPLGGDPDGLPNFRSGFGRLDVSRSIGTVPANTNVGWIDSGHALNYDEIFAHRLAGVPRGAHLTAVLCWADPPGQALQHELHLSVLHGGHKRLGNRKPGATQPDHSNNVQRVIWPDLPGGDLTLQVRCQRAWAHAQEFAVVWRVEPPPG